MKHIDPNQLSDIQNYKLLSGSIIPRPIAFVTSSDIEGNVNAAPFSFNIVNAPPMIAISARAGGKRKDTAINIETANHLLFMLQMKIMLRKLIRPLHLSILKIMNLI